MSKVEPSREEWNAVDRILESAVSEYNQENSMHGEVDFYPLEETVSGDSSVYEFSRENGESYLLRVRPQAENGRLVPDLRNEFNMPRPLFKKIVRYTCLAAQADYM